MFLTDWHQDLYLFQLHSPVHHNRHFVLFQMWVDRTNGPAWCLLLQEDILLGTLTVRENLTMSANLRLPGSVSKEEKTKMVDEIIIELGLTHCADSKVSIHITNMLCSPPGE